MRFLCSERRHPLPNPSFGPDCREWGRDQPLLSVPVCCGGNQKVGLAPETMAAGRWGLENGVAGSLSGSGPGRAMSD